nr:MAG TPA: STRUCTURAL MAINTENANCE OF CHROMOSOMES PROTEIN [Caudoviricetes sp.]
MATKRKIGATIALDGEKEFRSAVTKSTSALKTMKSEMSLVENQFKGQQNTMEALTAKHTVLEKTLEKTKKVEQDTAAALANAQKNYEKAGTQLDEYRAALTKAEKELETMKSSSSATSEEIAEQENKVKELNRTINSGEREYEKAAGNIETWQQKLNRAKSDVISVNRELDENASYMKEASTSSDGCAKSIDGFGKKVKKSSEDASAAVEAFSDDVGTYFTADKITEYADKISSAFKQIATDAVDAAKELDEGYDAITTRTGATGDAFNEFKDVADDIFGSIPATMLDVGDAVGEVNTRFHSQGDELKKLSTYFLQYAKINGTDVAGSIDKVQKVTTAFNLKVEETPDLLDVLSKVAQDTGANVDTMSDELVSNATAFKELGLNAYESATLLGKLEVSSADAGKVLSALQKGMKTAAGQGKSFGDALKEAQYAITNSKTETEGLNAAYNLFGKSGEAVYKAVRDGSLDLTQLSDSMDVLNNATGTVSKTYDATLNSWDRAQVAMNSVKEAGSELAEDVLEDLVPAIEWVADNVHDLMKAYKDANPVIQGVVKTIAGMTLAVGVAGPKLLAFYASIVALKKAQGVSSILSDVATGINELKTANQAATAVTELNTATTALSSTSSKASSSVKVFASSLGKIVGVAAISVAAFKAIIDINKELDSTYKDTIESAENCTDTLEESAKSVEDTLNDVKKSVDTLNDNESTASPLIKSLDELSKKSSKTPDDLAQMETAISQLNAMYPDWQMSVDKQTGQLKMQGKVVADVTSQTKKLQDAQKKQQTTDNTATLYQSMIDGDAKFKEAYKEYEELIEYQNSLAGSLNPFDAWKQKSVADQLKQQEEYLQSLSDGLEETKSQYEESVKAQNQFADSTDETNSVLSEHGQNYVELAQRIKQLGGDIDTVGDSFNDTETELQSLFESTAKAWQDSHDGITDGLNSEIGTLSQNITQWQTYKEQVLDSLQSASSMFSEVSKNDDLTWSTMTKNLDDNINRYQTWNDNVSSILQSARYQNDEAFREIANSIMTGGIDSADYLQKFVENVDLNTSQASNDLAEFARMDGVTDTYAGTMANLQTATENSMSAIAQAYDNTKTQAQQSMQELSDTLTEQAENYQAYAENAQNIVDSEKYKTDEDFREFANQLLSQGISGADAVASLWEGMQDGSQEVDAAVKSYSTLKDSINNYADAYASIQTVTQNGMNGTVQIVNDAGGALETAALNDSMMLASGVDMTSFVEQMRNGASDGQTAFTSQLTSDESLNGAYESGNMYGNAVAKGVVDGITQQMQSGDTVATLLQDSDRVTGGHNLKKSNRKNGGTTVNMTVNGSKNQDVRELSDQVVEKIRRAMNY